MLRLTLAQMRRSVGRLTAAGVAIVIGTAFVAATLLAGNVMTRTTYDSIAARYAGAELVVQDRSGMLTPDDVAAVAQVDGVAAVEPLGNTYLELTSGSRTVFQGVIATTSDPDLMPLVLADGAWPDGAGEVALPPDVAERLGVGVGDPVTVLRDVVDDEGAYDRVRERLTVTGLVEDPYGAYAMFGGAGVLDADVVQEWSAATLPPGEQVTYGDALIALDPSADVEATEAAVAAAVRDDLTVRTPDEHAAAVAAQLTGGEDLVFMIFVLTFAAIALLVAGLVIANTFQVLVAQRTRTLALLRCVGANKGQIGRGVLLEAGILGAVSSAAGVVLGAVLGQAALWVASTQDLGVPLPTSITVTWQVVVIPIAVGTLVTVLSALVPARAATRVAPLAALRPSEAPSAARGAGRVRLVLSVVAAVVGFAMLGGGAALGLVAQEPTTGLLLGIAGGGLSFVGVAVGAVFWLPRVTALAGRLAGSSGPTARLAAANTLRNPRRTAATSTALLIGVTLVAMMSTGAASARTSLTTALDTRYPVDVSLSSQTWDEQGDVGALPPALAPELARVDGVAAVTEVATATVEGPDQAAIELDGVSPAAADAALRFPAALEDLAPGTVVLSGGDAAALDVSAGDSLALQGPGGSSVLTVAVTDAELARPVVTRDDLATLVDDAPAATLWVALEDPAAAAAVVRDVQDVVADSGAAVGVSGAAVERAGYEQVVDTMLGIVLGLLAVAVVIALIGVANTLSLSVIERRRESATLRAIGLSKGQLRGMLAIEGLLIAGVGAVLGIVLGLVYGWAGSAAALGVMGDVVLAVPWREIGLVVLVAAVAGLVASVVPARSAVRTSPVEALATE
ncbi:ABC transporter permease [Isoptericola variabilis]|nr:FtsX-like permease family protein [Isoptericola variabilis]